ncbi:hypothetical protein F2P56_004904 [Juglans regia]|uniref:AP2/ERF domain-containing protein n=2 Tax=Juglans regia TaxID=51240 RepID=A0A834D6F6_JUGRE|nr:dehydration-responsive element-binding protein 1A-like [Juglans regia]KAF5478338.1 hypothetical protein F2P56_004904 [Juglans regia]
MQSFSEFSDPHPFVSNPAYIEKSESSPLSDAGSSAPRTTHSDEEVILASSRPKKRAGRRIFKETRHPVYRGVRKRNNNKWVCEVREPNKTSRIWLGTYPTAEMAARAHDVAALALRGRSTCLNFADSAWRLHLPGSRDAKEIRRAAAEAAEAFRPVEFGGDCVGDLGKEEVIKQCQENYGSIESCVLEETKTEQENVLYVDEEALFNMRGLLVNMAEGLLLSPPSCLGGEVMGNDMGLDAEVSLWSFTI